MSDSSSVFDLAVVGAGPSGMAYALGAVHVAEQLGRPLSVVVLEAAGRPGGWVHTGTQGPYRLETGPYGYLDKHPELGEIVRALSLESAMHGPSPAAKNRFVLVRSKLRRLPTGPLSFLFSRILSLRGKLRLLREPWAKGPPEGDESVAAFATRRLGSEAAESLVVPMFTGIYAGDPDAASLAACFPRMAELERDYGGLFRALLKLRKQVRRSGQGVGAPRGVLTSFRGGLSTLMRAMADALGERLRLSWPVEEVRRAEDGFVAAGPAGSVRARALVMAAPARIATRLLAPLDEQIAALLGEIPYVGVSVVHTAYRQEDAARLPRGFGFLVPRAAGADLLGSVFVSHIFPDHAPEDQVLLRNVLGGALRPELVDLDDELLVRRVRDAHARLLGLHREPAFMEVARYPRALPGYPLGHLDRLAALDAAVAGHPGLVVTGNALRGIGLADCLAKNYAAGKAIFDRDPGGAPLVVAAPGHP